MAGGRSIGTRVRAGFRALAAVVACVLATGAIAEGEDAPFVVACAGGGDATTITEALVKAAPGRPIVVRAGTYRESLDLSRAVVIAAETESKEGPQVVVEGAWALEDPARVTRKGNRPAK